MMDWQQIRRRWQSGGDEPKPGDVLAAVQRRDLELRGQVERRDRLETAVAAVVAPAFAIAAWRAGAHGSWYVTSFCTLLTLWAAWVPVHLWRARRRLPTAHHDRPLVEYLREERLALVAQARMLERIWAWYLAPCAVGVIGLNVSIQGVTSGSMIYTVAVVAFFAVIARVNRHAARTRFRDLVAQIELQIAELTREAGQ